MSGKGRGVGRGAKRPPQQQQGPGVGESASRTYAQMGGGPAGAPPANPTQPPPASAWGPPPGASSRATHRAPPTQPGDVAAATGAMARMAVSQPPAAAAAAEPSRGGPGAPRGGNGNGNGAGGAVGRGAVRGRTPITPYILKTKPEWLKTKQGAVGPQSGMPISLMANYFAIITKPDWALYRYRVDIAPEEDRTGERKFLMRAHRDRLGGYLFDGTVLYTTSRLTSPQQNELVLTSQNRDESIIFNLTIREAGEVQKGDYAYLQVYNLLLRTCYSAMKLKLVGRDYFDEAARIILDRFRLELWPGYKSSIRQHENSILMCVEITHKVMRMETALDILVNCTKNNPNDYRKEFERQLLGCIVLTKYNNKTYRIDDVQWDITPANTFKYGTEEISYSDYMKRKYQLQTHEVRRQPMLVSRAKARDIRAGLAEIINLIPEHCYCTGITDAMRGDFQLMSALSGHTRVGPAVRIEKLRRFNERLNNTAEAVEQLSRFQMSLDRDLLRINGRLLPTESVLASSGSEIKRVSAGPRAEWNSAFNGGNGLVLAKPLSKWVVVTPAKFKRDASAFVEMALRSASAMGLRWANPTFVEMDRDHAAVYASTLGQVLDKSQPELIMCVVANNKGDRYAVIKKKCCLDRPVPTQVICSRNLNDPRKTQAVAKKVVVQMNCKVGGAPWSIEIPPQGLMVCGFDVCHNTSSRSQSFGAMVSSLDKAMSRYFSVVSAHTCGEELSNKFSQNIILSVKKYREVNGEYPARILIYRDGVGEGQLKMVVEQEVEAIKKRFAEMNLDTKLTFVIVTKRINTRLFLANGTNPPPGTVVDDDITDPEKYDFFLVPQSVNQGSVTPTSFNVVWDDMRLPPERLQKLTYRMCHMYFNWSGTVKVPAPCQYAHKLAFLVGQALHKEPNHQLEDLLYFL